MPRPSWRLVGRDTHSPLLVPLKRGALGGLETPEEWQSLGMGGKHWGLSCTAYAALVTEPFAGKPAIFHG